MWLLENEFCNEDRKYFYILNQLNHRKMNRFKTFTLLLGVLLIASTTSCTKEKAGVYSPKKKIQRVYHSSPNTEKYLEQVWKWGDKTLESIDYYSQNGYFGWTENFTYKENRLDRIDVYVDKEYALFTYNDNSLKSINYYIENNLSTTNEFTYQDGKVIKMVQTDYGYKSNGHINLLSLMFAPEVCESIEKCFREFECSSHAKNTTKTCEFIWDGDNISKLVLMANYGDGGMVSATCIFQCDQKNNPFKGYFDLLSCGVDATDMLIEGHGFFKNNVTKAIIDSSEGGKSNLNYSYQYDSDDFPTMQIMSFEGANYQYFTYYEYE